VSVFLNIVSAVLILPLVALAVFFYSVHWVAGHTVGSLFEAVVALVRLLPDPDNPAAIGLAVLATIGLPAAMIYLAVRFRFVLPLALLALGAFASAYVLWATGIQDAADNFLMWGAMLGVVLSGVQLVRMLNRSFRSA
jgi:hypothetical protein